MKLSELEAKFQNKVPGIMGKERHFAVMVPLVEREGELCLLFEVRARTMRNQPGDICFPGGRMEAGEAPVACVLRETEEELGIPSGAVRVIAELDVLPAPHGMVHAVLAQVDARAADGMKLNPAEVEEAFLVPLDFFIREAPAVYHPLLIPDLGEDTASFNEQLGRPEGYPWVRRTDVVPVWRYQNKVIWGMTGKIILWNFRREDWK